MNFSLTMKNKIRIWKTAVLAGTLLFLSGTAAAQTPPGTAPPADETTSEAPDSLRHRGSDAYRAGYRAGYHAGYEAGLRGRSGFDAARPAAAESRVRSGKTASERRFMHRLGGEFRPEYIFPTNPFVQGNNTAGQPIDLSLSGHLRYSFQFRPGSLPDRIYGGAYQGIGVAYYDFGNPDELGNPVAAYLFQGARIARISPRLSFDYEWNFGLSFGWKPYDEETNRLNMMMGSKMNAFLNVDFFLNWMVTREVDFSAGVSLSHFSNGNTKFPNAGLNSVGLRAGLTYNFGRNPSEAPTTTAYPAFPRHFSYDLTLFGSWRRKGIEDGDIQVAAPDAYTVVGFNFASMYNFGYKFRAGVSLDGVYDGSANIIAPSSPEQIESTHEIQTVNPGFIRQIALGLSARAEFVMPYFNIGIGLGVNVLHKGGDLRSFYQMLALKVAVTRNSFVHIGYSLRDFHMPNFLMLGVGYRFNNKYPRHR